MESGRKAERTERAEREITYQAGWKRGKIKRNKALSSDNGEQGAQTECNGAQLSLIESWNIRWIWRPFGHLNDVFLQCVLWAFPVAAFGASLWLIYRLSLQP